MDLKEIILRHLENWETFQRFGNSHLILLVFFFAACLIVPLLARRYLSPRQQHILGAVFGLVVFANFLLWYFIIFYTGTFRLEKDLPLQLCHYGSLFILPVMIWKNEKVFRILYFWVMAATLQAMVTPDLQADAPHYWFWRYWIVHAGPVFCFIYAAVVYRFRPLPISIWHSWLALNGVMAITAIINWLVGSNYAFLCRKPPVKSLFDVLGPWPWYLLVIEGLAFVLFALVYLPFLRLKNKKAPA